MTRARNIAGFSTITTTPSPVHVGPIGVLTATRIDGEFGVVDITSRDITAQGIGVTNLQVSGITTGMNVSGIITAQNGINFNGTSTNLNVSGIITAQNGISFNGTSTGLNVSGVGTISTLDVNGNADVSGNLTVGGVLTYEDVTNVDSVGVVTARGLDIFGNTTGLNVASGISTFGADVQANKITNTGGDTDTFINFPSADTFKVTQNGNDTFHIDSSGKVSINTTDTTGARTLLVTAQGGSDTGITFRGGTSSQQYINFADGTSGGAENIGQIEYDHNANAFSIDVAGSEALRITSGQLVGLGTVSPGGLFHTHTASGTNRNYIEASASHAFLRLKGGSTSYNSGLEFYSGASNIANITGQGGGGLFFEVGGSQRLSIASDGQATFDKGAPGSSNQVIGRFQAQSSRALDIVWHDAGSLMGFDTPGNHSYIFKCNGTERVRITSTGTVNIGGSGQTTHMLYLSSTGDAGIHVVADTDNSGENDNPYLSMAQDGSATQQLKLGMVGSAGQEFSGSIANAGFLHANNGNTQPLQLAHMDNLAVTFSNTEQSHFHATSGTSIGGVKIANRGNDTGACLLLQGHNNTGTPGNATNTQLTHDGSRFEFEIKHGNTRALHIGSSRRIRLPGIVGVSGSGLVNVSVESDGNLCTQSSLRAHKINITSISDTSWLYNLNPVTFNWRTKTEVDGENVWGDTADNNGTQYGLIAEEVKEVKNDFCFYDNNGDLSGVHYDRMIAPLIKAVQDLKKENDDLKTLIKNSGNFDALKSSL